MGEVAQMGDVLAPGQVIKPQMNEEIASSILRKLYGLIPQSCKELNSYDDRNYYFTVAPESSNPHLPHVWTPGYVLKITNSQDSKNPEFTDAQNLMILHLSSCLPVPEPVKNIHGELKSLETIGSTENMVRLLKYIPGKILYDIPVWSTRHFHQAGDFIARMDKVLSSFNHQAYRERNSIWFLSAVPNLTQFTSALQENWKKKLALEIIENFTASVKPLEPTLQSGIIHGDFNEQNILVKQQEGEAEYSLYSVLDFGDSQWNCVIYELAITIMYMMTQCSCTEPHKAGGYVIAGYLNHRDIPEEERQILRTCIGARYAQSLVMGAYSYAQDPGNEYLLITSKTGWAVIKDFWNVPLDTLYRDWDEIIEGFHPDRTAYFSSLLSS